MESLLSRLSAEVGNAFASCEFDAGAGRVQFSDRPDLAQFQCNGAMALAKQTKQNPRAVAEKVVAILVQNPIFEKVEIAGAGFINLTITDKFLNSFLVGIQQNPEGSIPILSNGDIVVLDYGGPNIAKPMHVGHVRTAMIGDSLRRLLDVVGFRALGDIHMGDWGTHLGLLFADYERDGKVDWVLNLDLEDADEVATLFEDMGERYPRASVAAKEDEALKARALEVTLKMQNQESPYIDLWRVIRAASVIGMKKNYDALDVHFDLWKGEADVHPIIAPMVNDLTAKGFAVSDDGARVIPIAREDDTKDFPPLILYKRDGAVMYGTTDLATIVERMELYNPSRIIYVVDQRQSLHFEQLFRAARKTGIAPDNVELTHAGFGTMNGTDGKPFKTRAGGVMRLDDLIGMAIEKAQSRMAENNVGANMDADEINDIAHKIAIAAIKFADLQNNRVADYVFDLDRLTNFEGKTGPYLLYQTVRIKSLIAKAGGVPIDAKINVNDTDRDLALMVTKLPEVIAGAVRGYAPHILCDHIYQLAQSFSAFYARNHIVSETNIERRNSWLALCHVVATQMEIVLNILGIRVPTKM
jgi:arginyl-tRNA synthetase